MLRSIWSLRFAMQYGAGPTTIGDGLKERQRGEHAFKQQRKCSGENCTVELSPAGSGGRRVYGEGETQMVTRPAETSAKLRKVGYWTRDQVVAMDRAATLQMARHHLDHASPELRFALFSVKAEKIAEEKEQRALSSQLTALENKAVARDLLDEVFAALPESGGEDLSRMQIARIDLDTAKVIRRAVASKHGMTLNDLDSACRYHRIVLARQEAMYLIARNCPSISFPRMGRLFGGRDHTTCLHGVLKHGDRNGLPRVRRGA